MQSWNYSHICIIWVLSLLDLILAVYNHLYRRQAVHNLHNIIYLAMECSTC